VERLKHDIAVLEMRSEQVRINLGSFHFRQHPEARKVRRVLEARIKALKRFAHATTSSRSKPTLH
jgi:hypothetical protein